MLYYDNHVHTTFSPDAKGSMEEACLFSCDDKIGSIVFTDHLDVNYPENERVDLIPYKENFDLLKKKYQKIYFGVEIGQPYENSELYKHALNSYAFDLVLMSVHNIPNQKDFYYLDYSKVNTSDLLDSYFDMLLKISENLDFDVLCHLDYPFRYMAPYPNQPPISDFYDKIDKILKTLIKRDKVLEVNTSYLYRGIKRTLPDFPIVKRYVHLGGKTVSLGSDAHVAENIAIGFGEILAPLKECGVKSICRFENRNRIEIEIN